jgi:hypothetical protein
VQLGEREGSGGPAIRAAWAQQHWRTPELWEDTEHAESHLRLRQVSLVPQESIDAVRARLGQSFDTLDELGRLALVTAHTEGGFDHARLCELTNSHSRDVTLKLQDLVGKGFLVSTGTSKTRHYALPGTGPAGRSDASVLHPRKTPESSEESSEESFVERRAWAPREQQFEALLSFCGEAWRTLPEIAGRLGRTENTVRTMYIRPLLAQGALERKYPASPRHPLQAYRTRRE